MAVTEFTTAYPLVVPAVAAVLGLIVGSFFNVIIHRLPLMMEAAWREEARLLMADDPDAVEEHQPIAFNLAMPPSHCPHCDAQIKPYHNIPLVSYLLLRGRCSNCHARISPRYPLVELVTAAIAVGVFSAYGLSWVAVASLVLCWSLLILTCIDLDHQLLPDQITLPLLWLGLLYNATIGPASLEDAVWGAAVGYLTLWSVYWLFKLVTGKEGMGYGDFKLLGMLGAWLGWQMLPVIVLLSSIVGAVIGGLIIAVSREGSRPLPFGPYLAGAGVITLFWGEALLNGYLQFAGMN